MSMPLIFVRVLRLVPALAVATLVGCGEDGPVNHAVSGRLQLRGGDVSRLAGSTFEVALDGNPTVRAFGEIHPDGRFELQSLQDGQLRDGVPQGSYTARIIPNDEDGPSRKQALRSVAPRYLRFETSELTIQVPPDGDVTIPIASN